MFPVSMRRRLFLESKLLWRELLTVVELHYFLFSSLFTLIDMDDILVKKREIFFNNLVLLGFDKVTFEKKYGIKFHKDMFVSPNKKGYDVITHFLFAKLSAVTSKDYNIPWPLLDKEHDRLFQKTCYTYLMNFSEENLVKFPRIVPSIISTFGGHRFYDVYLAFSCYVLKKTITKNSNISLLSRCTVTQENFAAAKQNLQLSTISCMQKFRDTEVLTHDSHLIWATFSKTLQECLHKLKQSLQANKDLIKEKQDVISSLYSGIPDKSFNLKQMMERCFECWNPIIKQRKNLQIFYSAEKKFWNYIASEVGENVENEILKGHDFNICIMDSFPKECCKELEKVGFSSSEKDGKLCILRFLKLFIAYLMYIADLLKKRNLNELDVTSFAENPSSVQYDLDAVKDLNKKLSDEIIPDVEKSIKRLKLLKCFENFKEDTEIFTSLPILSFNPADVKERTSHFSTQLPEEKELCHEECNDSVFMSEKDSSSCCMNSDSTFLIDDAMKTIPTIEAFTSKNERISPERIYSRNFYVPCSNTQLNISTLDDIDFASLTPFKMRESWHNVETLNSMTLPDMSFDE